MLRDSGEKIRRKLFAAALLAFRDDLEEHERAGIIESQCAKAQGDLRELGQRLAEAAGGRPGSRLLERRLVKAEAQARDWTERGVFVVSGATVGSADPAQFFAWGDPEGLSRPRAAVARACWPCA